jgi:two-component system, cell cycle response regulator
MGQGPDSRRPPRSRRPSGLYMEDEPTKIGKAEAFGPQPGAKRDRPYFIVLAGSNIGKMFKVSGDSVVIGRSSDAQIRLEDDGISRKHARVFIENGDLWIEDLKSANGTIINGRAIDRQRLADGDKLQVGATTILKFTYHDDLDDNFQQKMYDAALQDGLTGAFNKRHFLDRLALEIAYARRHSSALTLMMLDVDHFKTINDRYGHLAGDHVLVKLAQLVSGQLRQEDLFARYGGEEFAVLCRGVSLGAASVLAERIRAMVETTTFEHQGKAMPVTISIGVAPHTPEATDGGTQLIADADAALYDAKRGGRNRVVARGVRR